MISMRRSLLIMLALILLITQLASALWLWHESREQISFLVNETLSARARDAHVEKEIREAIASLLVPSLVMMSFTLILSAIAISWIIRPLNKLQQRLDKRSADNLTPITLDSNMLEIAAVTGTLNQLFSRLSHTIQQERLFTADAAHELRTPLAGIRLHLELLEQSGVAEARALVTRIDQLMHTVEQLLMLSRAGQNFASGHYQAIDISKDVIPPLEVELVEMLKLRNQRLEIDIPARAEVLGDAVLIRLMLHNLVENAHRYSPENSTIRIVALCNEKGVELRVIDQGPGIDESKAGELTQAFRRMDQRYGGSGLGLNIIIRIIQLHQGKLTLKNVDSAAGSGLIASCWLPHNVLAKF